ncbi:MAG: SMP-30/gluconolactonase/LRE family protein [Bryobacterales bacterium]|nr:SMP-30/gluconolactonase/LRE family protein [Bryobacterales bacterium]
MSSHDFLVVEDPAIQRIVPASSRIEQVATGFGFTEGPIWTRDGNLLFSDIPNNTIFRLSPAGEVDVFRRPSGYDGMDLPKGGLIGSNGLTLDSMSRVTVCEHGNRRVTRLERDGSLTVLADRFEGKRLNSPNDLLFHSNGDLYFTDPPYGLPQQDEDHRKELKFNGVFRLKPSGKLELLYDQLTRPNGLVFSPEERTMWVGNSDPKRRLYMRFDVNAEGKLANGVVFADVTDEAGAGNPDGMKIDRDGTLYFTGAGGVRIYLPDGKFLGMIVFPEIPANLHWGGADAQTLYVTARTSVYRIRLNVPGIRP